MRGMLMQHTNGLLKKLKKRLVVIESGNMDVYRDDQRNNGNGGVKKGDGAAAHITIRLADIMSVGVKDEAMRVFVLVTQAGAFKFQAPDAEALRSWVAILTPRERSMTFSARRPKGEPNNQECGWVMHQMSSVMGVGSQRRRFLVARSDMLRLYKGQKLNELVVEFRMDACCTVLTPRELDSGEFRIMIFGRDSKALAFVMETRADADRWLHALQDIIESNPSYRREGDVIADDLQKFPGEYDFVMESHETFQAADEPLAVPLTSMPYGPASMLRDNPYGTLEQEALQVSLALCPGAGAPRYGDVGNAASLIASVMLACFELRPLRNEVCCQLVRLTYPPAGAAEPALRVYWQAVAAFCFGFYATRSYLHMLHLHIRRVAADQGTKAIIRQYAVFSLQALERGQRRQHPISLEEAEAIVTGEVLARQQTLSKYNSWTDESSPADGDAAATGPKLVQPFVAPEEDDDLMVGSSSSAGGTTPRSISGSILDGSAA